MSLGFLTESALVPSKAKEIKIDAKSLLDLKAVVYQKDQERKRRLEEALTDEDDSATLNSNGASRLKRYAHLRGGNKHPRRSDKDRMGSGCRNKGVDSRSRRDEEAKAREAPSEDDDQAWSKRSAEMLRKKAQLYEEMANGGGHAQLRGECLVNFEAKKNMTMAVTLEKETTVEIEDEFGRLRKVAIDSPDYNTLQQRLTEDLTGRDYEEMASANWDKGGGSFVVSPWEKRLKSVEKDHLKEVHEQASYAQNQAHFSSSDTMAKKTRKQMRLERLRMQQERVAPSENAAFTSPMDDPAASEKATNFLNRLL
ncbi:uncharacterized protein PHALS_06002 [Plasmopara halstedii]|uniref:Uncharacterized protein n=1 Tax=Plasmopara halstedii TaxID=4781 RepID=A0A0P1ABL6_PLAHL|nr:uncharacterized protein PHALS_06002 [Plasmopara halstedii]CEG37957.1 hypothetical protein PHALS_06002 [Plasmopara halstedii]|eukprot:XP_024574326.1 hypothetical protein PHALS_06002 [Plasmopara halstedii]